MRLGIAVFAPEANNLQLFPPFDVRYNPTPA